MYACTYVCMYVSTFLLPCTHKSNILTDSCVRETLLIEWSGVGWNFGAMTGPKTTAHLRVDDVSTQLPVGDTQLVPIYSTADGDCLYNSISLQLTGDESLATARRVTAALELVLNEQFYIERYDYFTQVTVISFDEAVADVIHPHRDSSMWEIPALAEIRSELLSTLKIYVYL